MIVRPCPRLVAFAHALRAQLRSGHAAGLDAFLPPHERGLADANAAASVPDAIMLAVSNELATLLWVTG